ncbi:hypothetical protein LOZ58_005600 [Ophidiomyces ophidiicola]|nr:hypothetical protein LOZ65_005005 [Ophidiomyces ophidiicola]KAI1936835.1 hypothetical protein LOZ66_004342 [Ophidiomyces ophidiicola]KAI1957516.1 hypothetical protein LOZ58_005600 [Ophidiomyces ophidiicola]
METSREALISSGEPSEARLVYVTNLQAESKPRTPSNWFKRVASASFCFGHRQDTSEVTEKTSEKREPGRFDPSLKSVLKRERGGAAAKPRRRGLGRRWAV